MHSKRTHSIVREHILQSENTFYSKRTHSIVREHSLLRAYRSTSMPDAACNVFCGVSFFFLFYLLCFIYVFLFLFYLFVVMIELF